MLSKISAFFERYLFLVIGAVVIAMLVVSFFIGIRTGYDRCLAKGQKDVEKHQAKEVKEIAKVEEINKQIEVRYVKDTKIIYQAADPTGCLTSDIRDIGLGGLLDP